MKILLLTTIFFLNLSMTQAALSELSKEYLNSSFDNEDQRLGLKINQLTKNQVLESKAWALSAATLNTDSKLKSSSTFLSTQTQTNSHSLELSKSFFTGTEFTFSNTYSTYDNDLFPSTNNKGFTQSLSLTQDLWKNFLGRNDDLDRVVAEKTYNYQDQSTRFQIETNLFNFVTDYINVKVARAIVDLQELAVKRAQKRLNLIKRRVKDGLSERVDLYSARTQELASIEKLKSDTITFDTSVESLSKKLHRKVQNTEVLSYKLGSSSELELVAGKIEENNGFIQTKKQIEYLKDVLTQKENGLYPTLAFSGTYATNEYKQSGSPISGGTLGNSNNQVSLGLSLTWNIGSYSEKLQRESSSISLNRAKMESRQSLLSLKEEEDALGKRLREVDVLIESALERLDLANKTLQEYNRLYSRGRATLDQVIRAEEDLISTQVSYVRYLFRRDSYTSKLAYLHGKLNEAVFK
ncbi:hypothetical protein A9Q84_19440 [Halobacteriovorax marinus]|uniref:Outer membrane protein n=1 Tax=Halobacteriovorax marinus TaxID=97084 RepID=A0A1Y5F2K9_9BACT|nr:hypothetical protein A9Q84_19440 [Halobacteriovorax marinus]